METTFTPVASLLGGILIGVAAVLLMAMNGRVAGASGIIGRILAQDLGGSAGRTALFFILGLMLSTLLYGAIIGGWPQIRVSTNMPLMVVAGLLVGFGSALGNGCTSGHGVCGISRFSKRSIIATMIFMSTSIATVFFTRHLLAG